MFKNIAVIIPIVRPEKAKRAIEAVQLHCPGAEIIAEEDTEGIGCPKMVAKLLEKTSRPVIMFLGDDTIIKSGVLQAALAKMEDLPNGWGAVGLNTLPFSTHAHWVADRRMLELIPGGQFFPLEYEHCFGDQELEDIAKEHGRWAFSHDSVVQHDHPVDGFEGDDFYLKAYGNGRFLRDQKTYYRRKRERVGGKLAIGYPLVNEQIHVNFHLSMMAMQKPNDFIILTPRFPHGNWVANIDEARNNIVEQALKEGVSHLMMCDTDQVYPTDTLERLASHNVDVCGVVVHRRYPPFDPIMLRRAKGAEDKFVHVEDEEMFSGDLIEIDGTGTGCLLINMAVFDLIDEPWFKLPEKGKKGPGEDLYFCKKVRDAGVKIHIDTSVRVGHLATVEIDRGLYEIAKQIPRVKP